jgi:hypothetical protein
MLSPLRRTQSTSPALPAQTDNSFEAQRRAIDLRHREEQVAAERQQVAQDRRQLERDRQNFEEQREERREQQRTEQHAERRRVEAEVIAGDLAHDVDRDRPGHTASLILQASRKARGQLPEEPLSEMAAAILRAGAIARGEVVADAELPTNETAKAVILCGRRARGESISEGEAAWLSAFLQRQERDRHDRRR